LYKSINKSIIGPVEKKTHTPDL